MTGGDDRDGRDDRDLLADHVAGDPEAFGLLFARHRDRLYAVALRTAGDPELAGDALQEGMIAAFRRAGSFRGDSAVTTWLHRVVVNATLDLHRRNAVRTTEQLTEHSTEHSTEHGPGLGHEIRRGDHVRTTTASDPLDAVIADEQRHRLLAALRRIPADQRAALVLVDMEGWSIAEAATVLDCRPGTVKSRCSRGRARLAQLLTGPDDGQSATMRNRGPASYVQSSDMSTRVAEEAGEDGSP